MKTSGDGKRSSPRRRGGAEKPKNLPRRHRDTERKSENADRDTRDRKALAGLLKRMSPDQFAPRCAKSLTNPLTTASCCGHMRPARLPATASSRANAMPPC